MSASEVAVAPDCAERLELACSAAWEIEALAVLLQHAASTDDVDSLVVRGVTMRMQSPAGVVMGAVGDISDSPKELNYRLSGVADRKSGATPLPGASAQ